MIYTRKVQVATKFLNHSQPQQQQQSQAIEKGEDASVCFLNYKADGTPFWNQFFVAPLRDDKNRIVNYVGAQCLVPGPLPPERPTPTAKPPESVRGGTSTRGGRSSKGRGKEGSDGTRGGRGRSGGGGGGGGTGNSGTGSTGKGDGRGRSTAAPRSLEEDEGRTKGGEGLSGRLGVKEEGREALMESPKAVGRKDRGLEEGGEDDDKETEWNRCLVAADAAGSAATGASGFCGDVDGIMDVQGTASVDPGADGDATGAMLQTDELVML